MKRRSLSVIPAFILTVLALGSCGNTTPAASSGTTAQTTTTAAEQSMTEPSMTESSAAEQTTTEQAAVEGTSNEKTSDDTLSFEDRLISESLFSLGSTERFRKVFEKAKNGEEITVAYIGGSITEGYTVKPEECWAYLTHRWLCEKYPDAKINYVNAGLSGTPSTLGLIRCERDVIEPCGEPDIVFVEFAVNDDSSAVTKEAYESLVRKLLLLDSAPAVSLIFMRTDNGYSCQDWQREVGYLYHLPMISVNDALSHAIDNGDMTWANYSNDGAHPNPEGCKMIASMVEYMLDAAAGDRETYREYEESAPIDDVNAVVPIYGSDFVNMHLTDAAELEPVDAGEYTVTEALAAFPNAWTRKGGENEGITFDMEFDDLFMVYHCNKSKHYGTAEVYVDGELKTEVVSNAADGWSNPVPQLITRGEGKTSHTVEVKIKGDGEKVYFGILAFGFTD